MSDSTAAVGAIIVVLCGIFFFLPTLIASKRNHHNTTSIFLLNLFLGVTGIGWVIALVWAFTNPPAPAVLYLSSEEGRRGGWKS